MIDTRSKKKVVVDNGDTAKFNSPKIILGEFIPFYFGVKMPMLYVMQNGGNFVKRATPAKDIVYLACSLIRIIDTTKDYYFSDGHGTDNYTTFYDSSKINDLATIIDWSAVKAAYWGGNENLNIKRKKQAEFLVSNDISPKFVIGFGCHDQKAAEELIAMGVVEEKVKIIPNAYY